jgi:hypothetical protein
MKQCSSVVARNFRAHGGAVIVSEILYSTEREEVEFIRKEDLIRELAKPLPDDFETYTPGSLRWRRLPGEIAHEWMPPEIMQKYGEKICTDMGAGHRIEFDLDDALAFVAALEAAGHSVQRDDQAVSALHEEA